MISAGRPEGYCHFSAACLTLPGAAQRGGKSGAIPGKVELRNRNECASGICRIRAIFPAHLH